MRAHCVQQGLTLVELLLGLALSAMLMTPLAAWLQGAADSAGDGREQLEQQAQARFAVQRIATSVRARSSIGLPATPADTGTALGPLRYWIRTTGALRELVETDSGAPAATRNRVLAVPVASLAVQVQVPDDGVQLVSIAVVMAGQASAGASATVRLAP